MSFANREWINEVKGSFIDFVNDHGNIAIATNRTLSSFKDMLDDNDDAVAIWLGLALGQWNYGMLQLNVKERAVKEALIKSEQCREAGNNKDAKYLQKLIEKLNLPNLKPQKVVKKQQKGYICPWNIGDVYAYEFVNLEIQKNVYAYFVKIDNYKFSSDGKFVIPLVYFYSIVTNKILNLSSVLKYPIISAESPKRYEKYPGIWKKYRVGFSIGKEKEVPNNKLTFLGNISKIKTPIDESPPPGCIIIGWEKVSEFLTRNFREWNVQIQP